MIKAEYIDSMGDDLRVANAARVSFDKNSKWEWVNDGKVSWTETADGFMTPQNWPQVIGEVRNGNGDIRAIPGRDARLIAFLARENHFTPFTHCMITLRETVPIFVARQRFKHQIGFTYNEVSRRYVDDEPEFYTPDVWRKRADNVKQGSSDEAVTRAAAVARDYAALCAVAKATYDDMICDGVAPEQARMVLPQSMLTSYYVTGSLAAFARAYSLRTHKTAQREIQELAAYWDTIIRPLFPVSWAALVDSQLEQKVAA